MKKRLCIAALLLILICMTGSVNVFAASEKDDTAAVFEQQANTLNSEQLFQSLPQETRDAMLRSGITSLDYENITELHTGELFGQIMSMLANGSKTPLCGLMACLGIILLCSVTEGFRIGTSDLRLGSVQNAVGTMCICTAIIIPFSHTISSAAEIISGGAGFMLLYVPMMAGLLVSSGSAAAGASYYAAMMTAGNVVSAVSSKLIVPLMNVFLALSVTSSISPKMQLGSLCESVYKVAKWILTLVMSVFITVMSLNTMISSSMDSVSKKALKFTVSSFVPVVGGVLSEALNTFNGSLELLKTGAGVFVIIAAAFLVLPVLSECIIWQFSLSLLGSASEICGIVQMNSLFKTVSKAVGMLTAMLLCVLTVFIISTVIILLIARQ